MAGQGCSRHRRYSSERDRQSLCSHDSYILVRKENKIQEHIHKILGSHGHSEETWQGKVTHRVLRMSFPGVRGNIGTEP